MKHIIIAALLATIVSPAWSRSPQDDPPDLRIATAYMAFAYVSRCHEARAGYAYQAISGAELDRAKSVVKEVAAISASSALA